MWISQQLRHEVENHPPFHSRMERIVAREGGLMVRCDLRSAESLSCAIEQLEVVEDQQPVWSNADLAAMAERICDRVTYLLEPLHPIEMDAAGHAVLVRSREPRRRGSVLAYYELLANAHHQTTLRRYAYNEETRRRSAIEFALTADQLEILVDDLVQATMRPRSAA